MLTELKTLKKIIEKGNYDEDSHQMLKDYEKRCAEVARKKELAEKDGLKDWLELMNVEVSFADQQLKEKEDFTDKQRADLFATKRICRKFIELLTGDEEGLKNEILQDIDRNRE